MVPDRVKVARGISCYNESKYEPISLLSGFDDMLEVRLSTVCVTCYLPINPTIREHYSTARK